MHVCDHLPTGSSHCLALLGRLAVFATNGLPLQSPFAFLFRSDTTKCVFERAQTEAEQRNIYKRVQVQSLLPN